MKKMDDLSQKRVLKIVKEDGGWNWSSIQEQTKIGAGNGTRLFWLLVGIGIIKDELLYLPNGMQGYPITEKGKTFNE